MTRTSRLLYIVIRFRENDIEPRHTMKTILTAAVLILSVFGHGDAQSTPAAKVPAKTNARPDPGTKPPAAEPFDRADAKTMAAQCVSLDTEKGLIEIELFPESAPESVRNFLNLAGTGALDTTTFSRVVPNFVIQGGDLYTREGKVTAALGNRARKTVPDEPNKILHDRGIVSMARGDEPNSATTNFFILLSSAPYLDGKFAAFGRVTKGIEVAETINKMPVDGEKPVNPVRIKKAAAHLCGA